MDINAFGPNLSFFFSNGIDPEYAVIGRVAVIWAKALDRKYGADERAKLKYHIQTSGRSLHAQRSINDIRTTLQGCMRSTTTAIRCTPTPSTRPSPRRPNPASAGPSPSS